LQGWGSGDLILEGDCVLFTLFLLLSRERELVASTIMPRQRDDSTQDEEEEDEGALDLPIAHRKRRRRGDDSPTATSVSASAASASVSAAASAAPSPPNEHSPEEEGDKGISTRPKRRATTSRRGEQEEDKRDFKLVGHSRTACVICT
jgi:hypothetical protein